MELLTTYHVLFGDDSLKGTLIGLVANCVLRYFLTKRLLIVALTNFISWGEMLCMAQATGRPEASVIAMILVPLPRLVFSPKGPLLLQELNYHQ